jgi:hypothetical protein
MEVICVSECCRYYRVRVLAGKAGVGHHSNAAREFSACKVVTMTSSPDFIVGAIIALARDAVN